jgi:hypothetical protein
MTSFRAFLGAGFHHLNQDFFGWAFEARPAKTVTELSVRRTALHFRIAPRPRRVRGTSSHQPP